MKITKKLIMIAAVVLLVGATSVTAFAAYGNRAQNTATSGACAAYANDPAKLEAFKADRLQQMKEYLDAKVAAGQMTQAQADEALAAMKERMENCTGTNTGTGTGTGYGMMGRGYGMMGRGAGCGLYGG